MKVIIAGSRGISSRIIVWHWINKSRFDITEVVSGCARGVDQAGEAWARKHNVPVQRFPARWSVYGKGAGPIRNAAMADYADAAIVIHRNTPGSLGMIAAMEDRMKPFEERIIGDSK